MMKRRTALKLLAAPALMTIARRGFAKEKVTYAYLLDPAYDAVTWAMSNGKVTSDLIDVEARGLAIPQLIQATSAKQYDVIMTAVIALPPAAARGLELKVLSTALQQSAAGEGRRYLGQEQFADQGSRGSSRASRSAPTLCVPPAIRKCVWRSSTNTGSNAALEGGDLNQVEIQAPNLPGALAAGQIDAATLIHSQAFRAMKSGEFRPIAETGRDNIEAFGMRFISALNVSYPERLAQRPDAFQEFDRMFRESVHYALAHQDEVFGAVGKSEQPAARVLQLVVRQEFGCARHVHRRPRGDHHQVLRAVERDRDDPGLSRHPYAWSGSTRCAADGRHRHRVRRSRRSRGRLRRRPASSPICSRFCFLAAWEAASLLAPSYLLPGPVAVAQRLAGSSSPAAATSAISVHRCSTSRAAIAISFVDRLAARADPLLRAGAALRDRAPHRPVPQLVLGDRLDAAFDHVVRRQHRSP